MITTLIKICTLTHGSIQDFTNLSIHVFNSLNHKMVCSDIGIGLQNLKSNKLKKFNEPHHVLTEILPKKEEEINNKEKDLIRSVLYDNEVII